MVSTSPPTQKISFWRYGTSAEWQTTRLTNLESHLRGLMDSTIGCSTTLSQRSKPSILRTDLSSPSQATGFCQLWSDVSFHHLKLQVRGTSTRALLQEKCTFMTFWQEDKQWDSLTKVQPLVPIKLATTGVGPAETVHQLETCHGIPTTLSSHPPLSTAPWRYGASKRLRTNHHHRKKKWKTGRATSVLKTMRSAIMTKKVTETRMASLLSNMLLAVEDRSASTRFSGSWWTDKGRRKTKTEKLHREMLSIQALKELKMKKKKCGMRMKKGWKKALLAIL